MDRVLVEGFVHQHNLELTGVAGHMLICGQIACLGDIIITVEKALAVLDPIPDGTKPLDARVQTIVYCYNASVRGYANFLRYDNAHAHPEHPDPHHRHRYDWRNGKECADSPEHIGEPAWPHLSDFIDEVRAWYDEHHPELPNANAVPEIEDVYTARILTF